MHDGRCGPRAVADADSTGLGWLHHLPNRDKVLTPEECRQSAQRPTVPLRVPLLQQAWTEPEKTWELRVQGAELLREK